MLVTIAVIIIVLATFMLIIYNMYSDYMARRDEDLRILYTRCRNIVSETEELLINQYQLPYSKTIVLILRNRILNALKRLKGDPNAKGIEERIAELFSQHITDYKNVVSIELVNQVISQLGMPDGSAFVEDDKKTAETAAPEIRPARKFYRNPDGKTIGGVCTGLSTYFNIDVTIIRIIFIICLIAGLAGFWIYIILWIIAPLAKDMP